MTVRQGRQNLGRILLDLERITEEDINDALDYQREHGGFFGEALVALGVVNRQEVGWCLATQANIPYIFPHVSEVDPDTAMLVTEDWALRHMALPIMQASGVITLAVDSPLSKDAAEELAWRTGRDVELALAPPESIQKLIEDFFSIRSRSLPTRSSSEPVSLEAFHARAHSDGVRRWGISRRGSTAVAWCERDGIMRRFVLNPHWRDALESSMQPAPAFDGESNGESQWKAEFRHAKGKDVGQAYRLSTSVGSELLFLVEKTMPAEDFPRFPSAQVLEQARAIVQKGPTVMGVCSRPEILARDLLPQLPEVLLPKGHRSVYLSRRGDFESSAEVITVDLDGSEKEMVQKMIWLEQFNFDCAVLDLTFGGKTTWHMILKLAPCMLVLVDEEATRDEKKIPAAVDWLLCLEDEKSRKWNLRRVTARNGMGVGNGKD